MRPLLVIFACLVAALPASAAPDVRNGEIAAESGGRIWLVNPDAPGERVLPKSEGASWPAWSPDGGRIAFTSVARRGIFVMNADGTGLRRVTRTTTLDVQPAWSPDGRRLAFARYVQGAGDEIFVVGVNGRGLRRLTRNRVQDLEPDWVPSGRQIVFTRGGRQLWTIGVDGRGPRFLLAGSGPNWSRDGRSLAFARGGDIWVASLGEKPRVVQRTPDAFESRPAWSPDGTRIAVLSTAGDPQERTRVWVLPLQGAGARLVSERVPAGRPAWRPVP